MREFLSKSQDLRGQDSNKSRARELNWFAFPLGAAVNSQGAVKKLSRIFRIPRDQGDKNWKLGPSKTNSVCRDPAGT